MAPLPSNTVPAYFKSEPPALSSGQTLAAALPSGDQTQLPSITYTSMSIGELAGGLKYVTVTGRILALREQVLNGRSPSDIRLIFHMTVGDETGALIVILNYIDKPDPVCIGLLVTVCAREIWSVPTIEYQASTVYTSIFPGQSAETLIQIRYDDHQPNNIRCRVPHYYRRGEPFSGLTTLENFLHGSPPQEPKVLVVVWSLAYKDTLTTPRGQTFRVELDVLDTSFRAPLILTDVNALSVPDWTAGRTVLLLSVPERPLGVQTPFGIGKDTLMHIDPDIEQAKALKEFASEQMGKQVVKGVFDVKHPLRDDRRVLFTVADLDDSARTSSWLSMTGFIYLMIVEMELYGLYRRSKLFAGLCPSFNCNSPVTSPTPQSRCSKCRHPVSLGINPRIVGLLIDETGGVLGGQMVWMEEAWHQLLGLTTAELAKCNGKEIRRIEQRLLFLSIVVLFGWSKKHEGGKVCVLKVGSL